MLVQIAVLFKNPNFQGRWSTSRWPWTFLEKSRGCLGIGSKCFCTRLVLSERKKY